jgi:hypothetical protein
VTKLTKKKEKPQKTKPQEEEKLTEKETPKEQSPERPVATEPQPPLESLTYPFKVLISPLKAFKKIAAYPDIKGLAIILGLLLLTSAGVQYFAASKIVLTINTQPTSLLATSHFQDILLTGMTESVFLFVLNWLLFAGALLVINTVMGAKGGRWRPFFILVGYAFTVFVVRTAITAALISALPQVNFNLSSWPPTTDAEKTDYLNQISTVWGPLWVFQVLQYFPYAIDAWLVILGVIVVHTYHEVTWSKAATISVTAYLIYFTLKLFFGLGF